jgi:hypothetical protein
MAYGWIITADFVDAGIHSSRGLTGPNGIGGVEMITLALSAAGRTFCMTDEDGEVYYTGRIYSDNGAGSQDDFGPLDDFGSPNAGCTEIRYYNPDDMMWEVL